MAVEAIFSNIKKIIMLDHQLPVYLKFLKLIKFFYGIIRNFPKQYKYTLGQNILDCMYLCLDLILEANSLPNNKKYPKIVEISVSFDKLKVRLRIAQEIGIISEKQFVHIQTNYIKEIGEMIGGWGKWANNIQYNNRQTLL